MAQDTRTLKPAAVRRHEGEARWWFGSLAVIKATAADTGGQMTIVEMTEPAGVEGPLHVHHREDEGFWILEGGATRMLFICTPGGFEDLVVAMSQPAHARTLPPPSEEEPDWARVAAIARAHGAELLG